MNFLSTFRYSSAPSEKTCLILVFLLLLFFRLPMVYLGLDVTDTGYHLVNQDLANLLGLKYIQIAPPWWFSDIVGGWWLKIADGLLWARLGGLAINCLSGMVAVKVLFSVCTPRFSIALSVVAGGLLAQTLCLVQYETVPILLFLIWCLFFIKMNAELLKVSHQIISGVTLALLVFSRMPMILTLGIPFFSLFLCLFMEKGRIGLFSKAYAKMLSVTLFCFLLFGAILWANGLLESYLFFPLPSEHYEFYNLFNTCWYQFRFAIQDLNYSLLITIVIYLVLKLFGFSPNKLFLVLFLFLFMYSSVRWISNLCMEFICIRVYLIALIINIVSIYLLRKWIVFQEILVFIVAASMPLLFTMGSASGLWKIHLGLFLLGGATINILLKLPMLDEFHNCKKPIFAVNALFILVFGFLGFKNLSVVYRDTSNRSKLVKSLEASRLRGIYTTSQRAESFNSLIREVKKYTQSGDRVLAYHYIPLVYYASNTLPYGNHSWLTILSLPSLEKKVGEFSPEEIPSVIVKSKTNAANPEWGLSGIPIWYDDSSDMLQKIDLLDQAIKNNWDLKLVWSNSDFDLFIPSRKMKSF